MTYGSRHKKIFFVQTVIILVISLTAFLAALLTGMLTMAVISGVTLLFGLLKVRSLFRPREVYRGTGSFIAAIVLTFILCTFTSPIISYFKFQYPLVQKIRGQHLKETFIGELPKGATGYSYESMPSILQGDGFDRLKFRASGDYIEDLRKKCESESILSFKASEPDPEADSIYMYYSEVFEEHQEGTVYIFYLTSGSHARFMFIMIDGNQVFCYEQ